MMYLISLFIDREIFFVPFWTIARIWNNLKKKKKGLKLAEPLVRTSDNIHVWLSERWLVGVALDTDMVSSVEIERRVAMTSSMPLCRSKLLTLH